MTGSLRLFFICLGLLSFVDDAFAQANASCGHEMTLRLDYIFSGTDGTADISLDEMSCFDGWAGRRHNMDSVALRGNGQICMRDNSSGEVLYRQSFSTLFQEWQATEEATRVRRSFENVFLLPMPDVPVTVRVELYGFRGGISASVEHEVNPGDILIRHLKGSPAPHKYLLRSGSEADCIDVAIVAEGYDASEAEVFYSDAAARWRLSLHMSLSADIVTGSISLLWHSSLRKAASAFLLRDSGRIRPSARISAHFIQTAILRP